MKPRESGGNVSGARRVRVRPRSTPMAPAGPRLPNRRPEAVTAPQRAPAQPPRRSYASPDAAPDSFKAKRTLRILSPSGTIRRKVVAQQYSGVEDWKVRTQRAAAIRQSTDALIALGRSKGMNASQIATAVLASKKKYIPAARQVVDDRLRQASTFHQIYGYGPAAAALSEKDQAHGFADEGTHWEGRLWRDARDMVKGLPASAVQSAKAAAQLANMVTLYYDQKLGMRKGAKQGDTRELEGFIQGMEETDPAYAIARGVVRGAKKGSLREVGKGFEEAAGRISKHPATAAEFLPLGRYLTAGMDVAKFGSRAAARARPALYADKLDAPAPEEAVSRLAAARKEAQDSVKEKRVRKPQSDDTSAEQRQEYSKSQVVRIVQRAREDRRARSGKDPFRVEGKRAERMLTGKAERAKDRGQRAGLATEIDVSRAIGKRLRQVHGRGRSVRIRGVRERHTNAAIRFMHSGEVMHGHEIEDLHDMADTVKAHILEARTAGRDTEVLKRNWDTINALAEDFARHGEDSMLRKAHQVTHGKGGSKELADWLDDELVRTGFITTEQKYLRRKGMPEATSGRAAPGRRPDSERRFARPGMMDREWAAEQLKRADRSEAFKQQIRAMLERDKKEKAGKDAKRAERRQEQRAKRESGTSGTVTITRPSEERLAPGQVDKNDIPLPIEHQQEIASPRRGERAPEDTKTGQRESEAAFDDERARAVPPSDGKPRIGGMTLAEHEAAREVEQKRRFDAIHRGDTEEAAHRLSRVQGHDAAVRDLGGRTYADQLAAAGGEAAASKKVGEEATGAREARLADEARTEAGAPTAARQKQLLAGKVPYQQVTKAEEAWLREHEMAKHVEPDAFHGTPVGGHPGEPVRAPRHRTRAKVRSKAEVEHRRRDSEFRREQRERRQARVESGEGAPPKASERELKLREHYAGTGKKRRKGHIEFRDKDLSAEIEKQRASDKPDLERLRAAQYELGRRRMVRRNANDDPAPKTAPKEPQERAQGHETAAEAVRRVHGVPSAEGATGALAKFHAALDRWARRLHGTHDALKVHGEGRHLDAGIYHQQEVVGGFAELIKELSKDKPNALRAGGLAHSIMVHISANKAVEDLRKGEDAVAASGERSLIMDAGDTHVNAGTVGELYDELAALAAKRDRTKAPPVAKEWQGGPRNKRRYARVFSERVVKDRAKQKRGRTQNLGRRRGEAKPEPTAAERRAQAERARGLQRRARVVRESAVRHTDARPPARPGGHDRVVLGDVEGAIPAHRGNAKRPADRPFANWVARSKPGPSSVRKVETALEAVQLWMRDRVRDDDFMAKLWDLRGQKIGYMSQTTSVSHADVLARVADRLERIAKPASKAEQVRVARRAFGAAARDWSRTLRALPESERAWIRGERRRGDDQRITQVRSEEGTWSERDVGDRMRDVAQKMPTHDDEMGLTDETAASKRKAAYESTKPPLWEGKEGLRPTRPPELENFVSKLEEGELGPREGLILAAQLRTPDVVLRRSQARARAAREGIHKVKAQREGLITNEMGKGKTRAQATKVYNDLLDRLEQINAREIGEYNVGEFIFGRPFARTEQVQAFFKEHVDPEDYDAYVQHITDLTAIKLGLKPDAPLEDPGQLYIRREAPWYRMEGEGVDGGTPGLKLTSRSPVVEGSTYRVPGEFATEGLAREKGAGTNYTGRSAIQEDMGGGTIAGSLLSQARSRGQRILSNAMLDFSYHGKPVRAGDVNLDELEAKTGYKWSFVMAKRSDQPNSDVLTESMDAADEIFGDPDKGDMVHVIPTAVRDVWKHQVERPGAFVGAMRGATRHWVGMTLPFSIAWHTGNFADQYMRLLALGPVNASNGIEMIGALKRQLEASDVPLQLRQEVLGMFQAHFGQQARTPTPRLAETWQGKRVLGSLGEHLSKLAGKKGAYGWEPQLWAKLAGSPRDALLGVGGKLEEYPVAAQVGHHARQQYESMLGDVSDVQTMAHYLVERWKTDPAALDELHSRVLQTAGDWSQKSWPRAGKYGGKIESTLAAGPFPFVTWMRNALKWTLWTLPKDHPNALLAGWVMSNMTREQRKQLGLEYWDSPKELYRMGMPKPLPIGTVSIGGKPRYLGGLFSVSEAANFVANPAKWAADKMLPWVQSPVAAGWTGRTYFDDNVASPQRSIWDGQVARNDVKMIQGAAEAQGGGPVHVYAGRTPYEYKLVRYEDGKPVIYTIKGFRRKYKDQKYNAGLLGRDYVRGMIHAAAQFVPFGAKLEQQNLFPGTAGHWSITKRSLADQVLDPAAELLDPTKDPATARSSGHGWSRADEIRYSRSDSPFQKKAVERIQRRERQIRHAKRLAAHGHKRYIEHLDAIKKGRAKYVAEAKARIADYGDKHKEFHVRADGTWDFKGVPTIEEITKPLERKTQSRPEYKKQVRRYRVRARRVHEHGKLTKVERDAVRSYDDQIKRTRKKIVKAKKRARDIAQSTEWYGAADNWYLNKFHFRPEGTKGYEPTVRELERKIRKVKRKRRKIIVRAVRHLG